MRPVNGRCYPDGDQMRRYPTEPIKPLHVVLLGYLQCIINLDSEMANRALQLGVTEQQLHHLEIFCSSAFGKKQMSAVGRALAVTPGVIPMAGSSSTLSSPLQPRRISNRAFGIFVARLVAVRTGFRCWATLKSALRSATAPIMEARDSDAQASSPNKLRFL